MKIIKKVKIEKEEVDYYICDKCNKKVKDDNFNDEIISIRHTFGYGSKDKDGLEISFDVCEDCFMDIIKDIKYTKKEMF